MAELKKPVAVAPSAVAEKKAEPVAAEKKAEPVAAVKKPVAKKTVAKKPAVKKAAAKKPAAKKTAAKKTTATAAKKTTAAAAKKPAAKKTATKKAVAVKSTIELQFDDRNVDVAKLTARAAKDYKKNTKNDAKKIEIYVNASEKMVYYVADGFNGSFEA